MLSDEEKKAMEFIKSELQDEKVRVDYQSLTGLYGNLEIEILLNLIEKQSKEIKELKEKNKDARERIEYYLVGNFALNDFDKRNKELRKIEKILEE